jgi:hypothetical protein
MLLLVQSSLIAACAKPHPVSTIRMGIYPPRPVDCELELRTEAISWELATTHDMIGTISVQGKSGETPNAPRLLALLKPDACTLGGELVLISGSANLEHVSSGSTSSVHSYMVMRKKPTVVAPKQTF